MSTCSNRGKGKLYEAYNDEPVAKISYQIHEEFDLGGSLRKWWGELTLAENVEIREGDRYIIELEDKRKGKCRLKRRINKAVVEVPSRHLYLFQGGEPLK
jgi:hypothetical protein